MHCNPPPCRTNTRRSLGPHICRLVPAWPSCHERCAQLPWPCSMPVPTKLMAAAATSISELSVSTAPNSKLAPCSTRPDIVASGCEVLVVWEGKYLHRLVLGGAAPWLEFLGAVGGRHDSHAAQRGTTLSTGERVSIFAPKQGGSSCSQLPKQRVQMRHESHDMVACLLKPTHQAPAMIT
jgi:hypothetical protein